MSRFRDRGWDELPDDDCDHFDEYPDPSQRKCADCERMISVRFERCKTCQRRFDVVEEAKERERLRAAGKVVNCVLCGKEICSAYLAQEIADPLVYLVAVHVTHYRHEHVRYYNNSVAWVTRNRDYDDFKMTVNERAKRQLIRKGRDRLAALGVRAEHFQDLERCDEKTLALARKLLGSAAAAG